MLEYDDNVQQVSFVGYCTGLVHINMIRIAIQKTVHHSKQEISARKPMSMWTQSAVLYLTLKVLQNLKISKILNFYVSPMMLSM